MDRHARHALEDVALLALAYRHARRAPLSGRRRAYRTARRYVRHHRATRATCRACHRRAR